MHGSTMSLLSLVDGLLRHNIQVSMVIPSNWPENTIFEDKIKGMHINIYRIPICQFVDRTGWSNQPFKFINFAWNYKELIRNRIVSYRELCKVIQKEHPNLIHTNVGVIHDGFWAAIRFKIPHIFHIREYQTKDFGWKILPSKHFFEWMLKRSDAVITITDNIQHYFCQENNSKAITIYNGIYSLKDISFIEQKQDYFICASRISPEKGYEDIIESFSNFVKEHPTYKLKIAGSGSSEYICQLQELATKLNCNDQIEYLGFVPDIKDLLRNAKALIVASKNEGFGRMTAEAMMQGCIVIGRNTAGTKEIMDKVGGFSFMTQHELSSQMNQIANMNTEEYCSYAKPSQTIATNLFSTENYVSKIIKLYQSICRNTE